MTLLLDCIKNPRNLGNLLRIACAVGADAALCGGLLRLRHAKVRSQISTWLRPGDPIAFDDLEARTRYFATFADAVRHFRSQGRRIIGTSPQPAAGTPHRGVATYYDVKYAPTDVLALGHEEAGLGEAKLAMCDLVVRIPMPGGVNSLNVGDAAAIILYEALRQMRADSPQRYRGD
jgi:tRNA G18 (ribose-2'-O)-methylase SpoU